MEINDMQQWVSVLRTTVFESTNFILANVQQMENSEENRALSIRDIAETKSTDGFTSSFGSAFLDFFIKSRWGTFIFFSHLSGKGLHLHLKRS